MVPTGSDERTQQEPNRIRRLELEAARLQAILGSARDAIVSIDARDRITVFNPAAETMFGYAAAEVIGQNVGRLMGAADAAAHGEYILAYQRTGEAKAIGRVRRVEACRRSGELFPIELSVAEARVDGGVLYTAVIRDVTERERAETVVRTRVRQQAVVADLGLRALGTASLPELMQEAVERVADTLEVEYCKILELLPDRSGLVLRAGTGWRDGVVGQATVSAGRDSQAGFTLATGEPVTVDDLATESRFTGPALLREHQVTSGMSVVILGSTGPFGVLGAHTRSRRHFTTDDTHFLQAIANVLATSIDRARAQGEMRELEHVARQRERLADLGAIAAQVVHDLGNPVAALSLQTELLLRRMSRDGGAPPTTFLRPAERILAEVRRLDKLVSDFKDFARQQRLDLGHIDLRRFLQGLGELWRPVAAARGILLALDLPAGVPSIVADEGKLHRVLDNLVKNAVEAIDSGPGEIRIGVSLPTRDRVRISVSDSGAGIDPGARIFRLFETTKPDGVGLGLAVARQIALAHGGNLEVESGQPCGAVFHLDLPVQALAAR